MIRKKLFIFALSGASFFCALFAASPFALNAQETCDPCFSHSYYECTKTCGGKLNDWWCDGCCGGGCYIAETADCDSWQKCDPSEASGGMCSCDGSCLEKPKDPVYYNNPEYTHQPEHDVGNANVKLPVKLEWTDVPGWKNKGGPGAHKKEIYGPQSYVIAIKNIAGANPSEAYTKVMPESEFNSAKDGSSCLLKSHAETPWSVKACCGTDGTNCGQESNWTFTTSSAPEPILPDDPDWVGDKAAEGTSVHTSVDNLKLQWCAIPSALSYQVLIYTNDEGKEECIPQLLTGPNNTCQPYKVVAADKIGVPPTEITNADKGFFTKNHIYSWTVQACLGTETRDCGDWSQKWKFKVNDFELEPPDLYSPPDDPQGTTPVGLPVRFAWTGHVGSNSYVFEIIGLTLADDETNRKISTVTLDYPKLALDTVYKWHVKPCWDFDSKQCEDWSKTYTFRTTGRPPAADTMKPEGTDIGLPAVFAWEDVPGNKSFVFHIEGDGTSLDRTVTDPEVYDIGYPDLKPGKSYAWKVKTCARDNGEVCGAWSETKNLVFSTIGAPTNPDPADGSTLFTNDFPRNFTWDKVEGAGGYRITITYKTKAADETGSCPAGTSKEKIAASPLYAVSASCLGEYVWQVQSCFDSECKNLGGKGPEWTFTLKQNPDNASTTGGLVVCGRTFDDPKTAWNEREACNIGHIFILIKVIFEFFLFRLSIVVLVLLVLITGVVFYTSLGDAATIAQVKSLWRAAGIGYLLILFGWIAVSIVLSFFGYQFGTWWKIKN